MTLREYKELSKSAKKLLEQNVPIGTVVDGYMLLKKECSTDGKECSGTNSYGKEEDGLIQTLVTETNLVWKYSGIDEKGNIQIISTPQMANSELRLAYEGGYFFGPNTLNLICDTLYSTNKGIARNINIDDVLRILKYDELPDEFKRKDNYIYKTDDKIKSENMAKNIIFLTDGRNTYWISSTYICIDDIGNRAFFNIRSADANQIGFSTLFRKMGIGFETTHLIRPVVSLKSDIEIEYKDGKLLI